MDALNPPGHKRRRTVVLLLLPLFVPATSFAGRPEKIVLARFVHGIEQQQAAFIVEMTYQALGIRIEWINMPPERALVESNAGRLDGEIGRTAAIEETLPNLQRVDVQLLDYAVSAVVRRADGPAPTNAQELARLPSLGVVRGIKLAERMTQGWPQVTTVSDHAVALRMLKAGRLRALLGSVKELRSMADADGWRDDDFSWHEIAKVQVHHYLHRKHEALVPAVRAELRRLKGSRATVLEGLLAAGLVVPVEAGPGQR